MNNNHTLFADFLSTASDDERIAMVFAKLCSPDNAEDLAALAAGAIIHMMRGARMRVALEFISKDHQTGANEQIRLFAQKALDYADEFTISSITESIKRVQGSAN